MSNQFAYRRRLGRRLCGKWMIEHLSVHFVDFETL